MLKQLNLEHDFSSHGLKVQSMSTHYVCTTYNEGKPNEYNKIVYVKTHVIDDSLTLQQVADNLKDLVSPDVVLKLYTHLDHWPWELEARVVHHCEKVIFVIQIPKHLQPEIMKAYWFDEIKLSGVKFEKHECHE